MLAPFVWTYGSYLVVTTSGVSMRGLRTVASWTVYPVSIAGTFGLFAVPQSHGVSLVLSTYVPILTAAALVTVLEVLLPHRLEWRPPLCQ